MKAKMMKAEKSSKKDAMPMKKMNMGGTVKGYSKGGGTSSTVEVRGMGAARGRKAKIC